MEDARVIKGCLIIQEYRNHQKFTGCSWQFAIDFQEDMRNLKSIFG